MRAVLAGTMQDGGRRLLPFRIRKGRLVIGAGRSQRAEALLGQFGHADLSRALRRGRHRRARADRQQTMRRGLKVGADRQHDKACAPRHRDAAGHGLRPRQELADETALVKAARLARPESR